MLALLVGITLVDYLLLGLALGLLVACACRLVLSMVVICFLTWFVDAGWSSA